MTEFIMNEDQSPLERRADELREAILTAAPEMLAAFTLTDLQTGDQGPGFEFHYWQEPVKLSWDDLIARDRVSGQPLPPVHQAMILYYFSTSKETSPPGVWVSFSELSDGQFYNAAFQGYTSRKLLQFYGDDYAGFEARCQELCGEKTSFGDGAYRFQILPRVAVLAVYWKGDEDFPPSYKILFEDIVDYHLPTDVCAILGSMLTGKLISEYS